MTTVWQKKTTKNTQKSTISRKKNAAEKSALLSFHHITSFLMLWDYICQWKNKKMRLINPQDIFASSESCMTYLPFSHSPLRCCFL